MKQFIYRSQILQSTLHPEIVVKEVTTKKEVAAFVQVPFSIYRGNPYWVPALVADEEATFDPKRNPAYESSEAKLWIAYRDGVPVGRIAGIINHDYIAKWGNRFGRFGWLDLVDDRNVADALFKTVEGWAMSRGMVGIQGPLGFTDFDPEGLLVEGFDEIGTMSTIYNFDYYPTHIEALGYEKEVDWLEYEVKIPTYTPERVKRVADVVLQRHNLEVLRAKSASELRPYAPGVFELLNAAYSKLYGVVTLSPKLVQTYTDQYFPFISPKHISIILRDKCVVAFAIAIPSLSKALQKSNGKLLPFGFVHLFSALKWNNLADLFLVAVDPSLQSKGVTALLVDDLCTKFRDSGIQRAITHPILEHNSSMTNFWKHYDKRVTKRRRCYFKNLSHGLA